MQATVFVYKCENNMVRAHGVYLTTIMSIANGADIGLIIIVDRLAATGVVARVEHETGLSILLDARVSKVKGVCMADTGATYSIINEDFLARTGLNAVQAAMPLTVAVAGDTQLTLNMVIKAPIQLGTARSSVTMYVMPSLLQGIDMIIGMDWLTEHDAHIHTKDAKVTLTAKGKQHVIAWKAHTAAGLTVAALQASHENPQFISAKQAHTALKRGRHGWLFLVQATPEVQVWLDPVKTDLGKEFDAKLRDLLLSKEAVFSAPTGLPSNKALHPANPLKQGSPATYSKPYRLSPLEEQEVEKGKLLIRWQKVS